MNSNFDRNLSSEDLMRRRATILQRLHIDGILLLLLLILATGSLFILYSASGKNVDLLMKQASSFGIGLVGMFIIAQFEPRFMARWVPLAYVGGVALLVAVDVMGHNAMGATRWINIPGVIRFQPSEFMKIIMPATIAWYLSNRSLPPRLKHICISLAMIIVPFVLILLQPDLGTSLLIIASGGFVLFIAGLQWRWVIGAVLGKGWLQGTQSHLDFLPESHTDFIIAVLAEEFGLVGVCLLLLVYMLLIARGLVITVQAQTLFGKLLAGALTMTFFVYVFVNIGMVSGLLPVVGVPLPFISYGGTSMVTLLAGFGILMAVHTHRKWIAQV